MDILVIGGTRFVGRHIVQAALARGHRLTLFNRGKSDAALFADVEQIHGDRETDLQRLSGRHWDAVVDTCAYVPRVARLSGEALRDAVGCYAFISTISVYADPVPVGADESYTLKTLADPTVEQINGETYGGLKVLCEQALAELYGARLLNIRPGMIVGPNDATDRFTYWVVRATQGGTMLVPHGPTPPVQMIDVRDLAAWTVLALENGARGHYTTTGPATPLNWGAWLAACLQVAQEQGTPAQIAYVPNALLEAQAITGQQLPFWISEAEHYGIFAISVARAIADGMTYRPLIDTVRDTLAWHRTRGDDYILRAGLTADDEARLLALAASAQ